MARDSNPAYWTRYSNLQYVKHSLIENYLNGWLPKLGSWAGRIVYFDTHAGRGRHRRGQAGSPLVALRTLLSHKSREAVFSRCEIVFFFIESDRDNCDVLEAEIRSLGQLPRQVKYRVICEDCFDTLASLLADLKESGTVLAPAFIFVDPYGFKVPGAILRELMAFKRVELFINVIWRELSMAIAQGASQPGMADTLDRIFDGSDWRALETLGFYSQADACMDLMRQKVGAKWATHIRMLGPNGATRYVLLHLTNHDAGRDLMKDCVWKVCPDGGFFARANDNPDQQFLITPSPDLRPLREWVVQRLSAGPTRWRALLNDLRSEIWRERQLNDIIRELRQSGVVEGRNYEGRFVPKNDPELFLYQRNTGER